ncbi:MAG: phosphate signaling complex protein PhoU [Oscillospiraceae bacterium]
MRSKLDEQLELLNKELIMIGSLCENAISLSVKALFDGDEKAAGKVPELSSQVDRKEREIEGMCIRLLLQQQPVAKDLSSVSAALKMVTDMKRIGDQSADIAEIITESNISAPGDTLYIHDMAAAVIKMVTDSIDAFVKKDIVIANSVIAYDDMVDRCFNQIKENLIAHLSRGESNGEYALDLLMIAKYLERIGDHAVNIARWVSFSITGNIESV